jgi:hypothetical protein
MRRRKLTERVVETVENLDALTDVELTAEPRLARLVALAAQTEWRAAAWLLERLYPARYGRRGAPSQLPADDDELDTFAEVDRIAEQRRKLLAKRVT